MKEEDIKNNENEKSIQKLEDFFDNSKIEYFEDLRTPLLNPYMRPTDVCKILRYKDTWSAARNILERNLHIREKHLHQFPNRYDGGQENNIESFIEVLDKEGIYHFIDDSNMPKAKPFKEWLVHKQVERENYILMLRDDKPKNLAERKKILEIMLENTNELIKVTDEISAIRKEYSERVGAVEVKQNFLEEKIEDGLEKFEEQMDLPLTDKQIRRINRGVKLFYKELGISEWQAWDKIYKACGVGSTEEASRKDFGNIMKAINSILNQKSLDDF